MTLDWREDALCKNMDSRLFEFDPEGFPSKTWAEWTSDIQQAQKACGWCPVVLDCKKTASKADRRHTVRGSLQPLNYIRAERAMKPEHVIGC